MITKLEALELVVESDARTLKIIKSIEAQIKAAAKSGKCYVTIDGHLDNNSLIDGYLRELGYSVTFIGSQQFGNATTDIGWSYTRR